MDKDSRVKVEPSDRVPDEPATGMTVPVQAQAISPRPGPVGTPPWSPHVFASPPTSARPPLNPVAHSDDTTLRPTLLGSWGPGVYSLQNVLPQHMEHLQHPPFNQGGMPKAAAPAAGYSSAAHSFLSQPRLSDASLYAQEGYPRWGSTFDDPLFGGAAQGPPDDFTAHQQKLAQLANADSLPALGGLSLPTQEPSLLARTFPEEPIVCQQLQSLMHADSDVSTGANSQAMYHHHIECALELLPPAGRVALQRLLQTVSFQDSREALHSLWTSSSPGIADEPQGLGMVPSATHSLPASLLAPVTVSAHMHAPVDMRPGGGGGGMPMHGTSSPLRFRASPQAPAAVPASAAGPAGAVGIPPGIVATSARAYDRPPAVGSRVPSGSGTPVPILNLSKTKEGTVRRTSVSPRKRGLDRCATASPMSSSRSGIEGYEGASHDDTTQALTERASDGRRSVRRRSGTAFASDVYAAAASMGMPDALAAMGRAHSSPQRRRQNPSSREKVWELLLPTEHELILNDQMTAADGAKMVLERRAAERGLNIRQLDDTDGLGIGFSLTDSKATSQPLPVPKKCAICERESMVEHPHTYYCRRCGQLYRAIHRMKTNLQGDKRDTGSLE